MAFLMNAWYAALWAKDLPSDGLIARKLLGTDVVLFRDRDGRCAATSGKCPHRFAPLGMGQRLPSGVIRCAYHGLEFGADGRCTLNPHGDGVIPASLRLTTYSVVERHSIIWIWMGDKPADQTLIPDFSMMQEAPDGLIRNRDALHVQGNYLLMVDNLLDLTHANYLHDGYLGLPEHSKAQIQVEQRGNEVLVRRVIDNVPVAPIHDLMFKRDGNAVDMINESHWMPPSNLVLRHGLLTPGEPIESGYYFDGVHLLTPETEHSTHYLFGIAAKPGTLSEEDRRRIAAMRREVFEVQDKGMIEGQAAMLEGQDIMARKPTLLSIDAAAVRMRRIIANLIQTESHSG